MEKEAISGDAEMVGLPQSWQRMDAGADLIQEDRRAECTAAPSAILRPDGLPRNSEHNRPDATATDFRGTPITAGNRSQDGNKAATGRSREGNAAVDRSREGTRQQSSGRLRGGRSIFVLREGREMAEGSQTEEDCRNGGAAAEAAASGEIDWNAEEVWLSALAEAGISWSGTMQEFIQSDSMAEGARAEWENGTKELGSRIIDLMGGSDVRNPAVRLASAFRDSYDTVSWNARAVRFAAFVSDAIGDQDDGGGGGERLTAVGEEIAELEERLQELRAEQQELEAEQQEQQIVTVGNLAWNVTSDMIRGTFEQIAELVAAEVQYDEVIGRSLGWAVVEFRGASDAAAAVEGFNGGELAGRGMVVALGLCGPAERRRSEEDVI